MIERQVPAARRHTRWSQTKDTRDFLLGCVIIAAGVVGWSAWRDAELGECEAARVRGLVETAAEAEPGCWRVDFASGPAVRLEVAPGELAPRAGLRGRICENGHWHMETADEADF